MSGKETPRQGSLEEPPADLRVLQAGTGVREPVSAKADKVRS